MNKEIKQEISATLLGITVAVILWLTILTREGITENPLAYQPFHTLFDFWEDISKNGIRGNFLGNILLFIPTGVLYPIAFGSEEDIEGYSWRRTISFGFCLSLLIEFTQLIFAKGCFEIDDMILNAYFGNT
jgi:glycopeptide antibiotics resistance protein